VVSSCGKEPRRNERAGVWRIGRGREIRFARLPVLMGVVNVTPDSFSDGGRFAEPAAAIAHGLALVAQGADLLDVGGESTRPGAAPVEADEELARVLPVVRGLARQTSVPLSIDTSKAVVARAALEAGARVINDVTALAGDPEMPAVAREYEAGVCAMHMQGTPRTMQNAPAYDDVVGHVLDFLARRRDRLVEAGIDREQIALDPGIGFGKTTEHNLALLRSIGRFHALGCPVLVGPSRKRIIGEILGDPSADRTAGTVGASLALARAGVQILRVHDVAAGRHALLLFDASGGLH